MYVSREAEVSLLHTPQIRKNQYSTYICSLDIDAGFLIFRISITACLLFTAIAKTSTHAVISLQILTVILHFRLENGFK